MDNECPMKFMNLICRDVESWRLMIIDTAKTQNQIGYTISKAQTAKR
jgi:hypothetical protein